MRSELHTLRPAARAVAPAGAGRRRPGVAIRAVTLAADRIRRVQFMPPPFGPILISKEPKESVFKGAPEAAEAPAPLQPPPPSAGFSRQNQPPRPIRPVLRLPPSWKSMHSTNPDAAPPDPICTAAVLVLQRVGNLALTEDAQALEVFISGDSALGIYALLNGQATERPMALDVLWQVGSAPLLWFDQPGPGRTGPTEPRADLCPSSQLDITIK